ncbi:MAG: hypothetical protein QJR05_04200 [Thermoanaerobacterium sp.]|nr:hypothetical protein [Thermoanaerobacterium sp.]
MINLIRNNKKDIYTFNVRNNGTVLDLPDDVVIETNAMGDKNGAHSISIGHLSTKPDTGCKA